MTKPERILLSRLLDHFGDILASAGSNDMAADMFAGLDTAMLLNNFNQWDSARFFESEYDIWRPRALEMIEDREWVRYFADQLTDPFIDEISEAR